MSDDNTQPTPTPENQPPPCVGPNCGHEKLDLEAQGKREAHSIVSSPELENLIPMARSNTWIIPEYTYYTFGVAREFYSFVTSVGAQVCPSSASEQCEGIIASIDKFSKATQNSVGGCGCNRSKRVAFSVDAYAEVIKLISECPEACANIKKLLNDVERVHFWRDGQKVSNQARIWLNSNNPNFDWRNSPPESPYLII